MNAAKINTGFVWALLIQVLCECEGDERNTITERKESHLCFRILSRINKPHLVWDNNKINKTNKQAIHKQNYNK